MKTIIRIIVVFSLFIFAGCEITELPEEQELILAWEKVTQLPYAMSFHMASVVNGTIVITHGDKIMISSNGYNWNTLKTFPDNIYLQSHQNILFNGELYTT